MANSVNRVFDAHVQRNLLRLEGQIADLSARQVTLRLHSELLAAINFGLGRVTTILLAASLMSAAAKIILRQAQWHEWLPLYQKACAIKTIPDHLRVQLHNQLGVLYQHLGQFDIAAKAHEQAIAIAKAIGVPDGLAKSYVHRASVACAQMNLDTAQTYCENALAISTNTLTENSRAFTRQIEGKIAFLKGEYDVAIKHFAPYIISQIQAENLYDALAIMNDKGIAHTRLQQPLAALKTYDQALEIADQIGNPVEHIRIALNKSYLYLSLGASEEALTALQKIDSVFLRNSADIVQQGTVAHNIGYALHKLGRQNEALIHFDRAQRTWLRLNHSLYLANTLGDAARANLALGRHQLGCLQLDQSIQLLKSCSEDAWAEDILQQNQVLLHRMRDEQGTEGGDISPLQKQITN